ncbi:hypothetical protein [Dactylosporangium salmoneum]|uniref:Uncharacterized protein n=1 Tax=Dactylosporangium salmoneum TaxID=53361 RepID=A0ABP5SZJ4_9ACTN
MAITHQVDGLRGWTLASVRSLLLDPIQTGNADEGSEPHSVGRHRSQAMIDVGVRRTLVEYWDWPEEPGDQR